MNFIEKIFGCKSDNENIKSPKGWSETKITEDCYITHIPESQKDKWRKDKWNKDNLTEILLVNGFHIRRNGRSGTIYYVEKERFCEIYYELSAVPQFDILIFYENLTEWSHPKQQLTKEEEVKIKKELTDWLLAEKIKHDL